MSSNIVITNGTDKVEIPQEVASAEIGIYADMKKVLSGTGADTVEPSVDDTDELVTLPEQEACPKVGLEMIKEFLTMDKASRTDKIPKPLPHMEIKTILTDAEFNLMKRAEEAKCLPALLEACIQLKIDSLVSVAASYTACRVDEIAKAAPDIMTGAEELRQFLQIKNDWTEEEMEHLRKEMEYAKSLDPNVY